MDKVDRKYDILINILGADHTGYIKELNLVSALSDKTARLQSLSISKLYKNGQPFKCPRELENLFVQDLLRRWKDPIRFMMYRSNDVELDLISTKSKKRRRTTLFFMFNMQMRE